MKIVDVRDLIEDFAHPLSPIQKMNQTEICAIQNGGDHKHIGINDPVEGVKPDHVNITTNSSGAPMLANRPDPYFTLKKENHKHRVVVEKAAQGYNIKEIAQMTGYTPVSVNNILRQPFLQQTLVDEIRRINGEDEEVVEIIKQNVVASCKLYEEILNGGQLADSIEERKLQMEAAERFMNRRYGKPNQPVNRGTEVDLNTLAIAEIAAQLPQTEGTK